MTPEERDRLVKLEVEMEQIKTQLDAMSAKLDMLVEAATMGRGAWWLLLKVGAVAGAVVAGTAWVLDHLPKVK